MKHIQTFESFLNESRVENVDEPKEKDIVVKDKYKKGDYIFFRMIHPGSTMVANSKDELSKSVYGGRIEKVTKDLSGNPVYVINYQDVRHSTVIGAKK